MATQFATPESLGSFVEWRRNPITILFVEAIRELGVTPPPGFFDVEDIGVQFGVSSGLGLASTLLDNPAVLLPTLFTGEAASGHLGLPPSDYSTSPVSVLDELAHLDDGGRKGEET